MRCLVESRRPGEGAKDALAEHTTAIEVAPQPADDLPSKVAQGVLPYLLIEDHVLNPLSWFEQPAVFDLAVKLPDGLLFIPAEVHTGDESAAGSEHFTLWHRGRKSFLHQPHAAD